MSKKIAELIGDKKTVSLAGMCKNAGKTTVLNTLITQMSEKDIRLGLTSIGRDGETSDLVTNTAKPRIYIKEGTITATAAGLLQNCDITKEILMTTGIHTPLGEIVLIRALSDGFVDLAGPSMNQQLVMLSRLFLEFDTDKILIDGAISRKSLCAREVSEAVILCCGASYHKDIDLVVNDTAFVCELLSLKCPDKNEVSLQFHKWRKETNKKYLFLDEDGEKIKAEADGKLSDFLRDKVYAGTKYVFINGACTDALLNPLFLSNVDLKGKIFVVTDSSKLLIGSDVYEKLLRKGACLKVADEIELLAVTINPFSAYGNHFDKDEFEEKMKNKLKIPVFNVREDTF